MVAALADTGFATETESFADRTYLDYLVETTNQRPAIVPVTRSPAVRPSVVRPSAEVLRRRRVVAAGVLATILFGLFLGLQALFGQPGGGPLTSVGSPGAAPASGPRIWVVRPGDTLWSIAEASGVQGDIRPFVAKLSAEIDGQPLQPGERIVIP